MNSALDKEYESLKSRFKEGELTWDIVLPEGEVTFGITQMYKNVSLTHNPSGINIISDQKDTQIENGIVALRALIKRLTH